MKATAYSSPHRIESSTSPTVSWALSRRSRRVATSESVSTPVAPSRSTFERIRISIYGYAVTSHSSQGQTADRVLIHVDTEQGGEKLVNRRLAYVAVSRGRYDAQIYTNDKNALAEGLGREVSHRSALESTRAAEPRRRSKERASLFPNSGEGANNRTRP